MFVEKLYWENGVRLDSDILSKADTAIANKAAQSNFLPHNLSHGIVSLDIDIESLASGLILIKDLKIYISEKILVIFDKSYPLLLQIEEDEIAALVPIFLNVSDKVVQKDGNSYVVNQLTLSIAHDYNVKHSVQIASFRHNNSCLDVRDYDFPIFTFNHYLFNNIFLNINKLISEVKAFNKLIFSISRPYASIYLSSLISKLEREIRFAQLNQASADPFYFFNLIHDVYSLMLANVDADSQGSFVDIDYNFYKPFAKFNELLESLFKLCKHKKISNFMQFHLQGQKYICDNFPEEFFVAESYYFIIRKKHDVSINSRFNNKTALKITSISRNKNIVTLSLSGVKLQEADPSVKKFAISLSNLDTVYEVSKGPEWDFILVDKSAVFSAFEGSENFEFFIAFI